MNFSLKLIISKLLRVAQQDFSSFAGWVCVVLLCACKCAKMCQAKKQSRIKTDLKLCRSKLDCLPNSVMSAGRVAYNGNGLAMWRTSVFRLPTTEAG